MSASRNSSHKVHEVLYILLTYVPETSYDLGGDVQKTSAPGGGGVSQNLTKGRRLWGFGTNYRVEGVKNHENLADVI